MAKVGTDSLESTVEFLLKIIFSLAYYNKNQTQLFLTYWETSDKWIPCKPRGATTNWIMIDYLAFSSNTASTGTWIDTFLIGTSFIE